MMSIAERKAFERLEKRVEAFEDLIKHKLREVIIDIASQEISLDVEDLKREKALMEALENGDTGVQSDDATR